MASNPMAMYALRKAMMRKGPKRTSSRPLFAPRVARVEVAKIADANRARQLVEFRENKTAFFDRYQNVPKKAKLRLENIESWNKIADYRQKVIDRNADKINDKSRQAFIKFLDIKTEQYMNYLAKNIK